MDPSVSGTPPESDASADVLLSELSPGSLWHFDADSQGVFTVDTQGQVAHWQGPDFQTMQPLPEVGPAVPDRGVAISAEGRLLGVGSPDGIVRVWDLRRRALLHELKTGDQAVWVEAFLGPDRIATSHESNDEWCVWDLRSLRQTGSFRVPTQVRRAVSDDGRWALAVGYRGRCRLRDLTTGQETATQLNAKEVVGMAFSWDGNYFAVASEYGFAKMWETATLREGPTFKGNLTLA